jgi:hypothetical protein
MGRPTRSPDPNGINQQGTYSHSNNLQSTGNLYPVGYASSSSIITSNDIQSSSSTWNQYAAANLGNGGNQTTYDPNIY